MNAKPMVLIGTENDSEPPVIWESPVVPPSEEGQWREATDEEYQRYVDFYAKQTRG